MRHEPLHENGGTSGAGLPIAEDTAAFVARVCGSSVRAFAEQHLECNAGTPIGLAALDQGFPRPCDARPQLEKQPVEVNAAPVDDPQPIVGNGDFADSRWFTGTRGRLYTIGGDGSMFSIDPATGAMLGVQMLAYLFAVREILAADPAWERVTTLGRREMAAWSPRHVHRVVDFDRLAEHLCGGEKPR